MSTIVRNILAALAGVVVGGVVNMILVSIGPYVVPLPEGADVSTMEKLRDSMALFTPVNFVFPFLAHAIGTLAGAFVAARVAASNTAKFEIGIGIGVFFLIGGIAAVVMLGGPLWFKVLDLVVAYIPMSYLGVVVAGATPPKAG
jgi:hypothetical protein